MENKIALVGGLFKNMAFKLDFYQDNTLINLNVLRAAHETGVSFYSLPSKTYFLKKNTKLINSIL
jgi:hypothetical protein